MNQKNDIQVTINGKQYVLYNPKAAGNLALNFAFPFEKILV